MTRLVLTDFRNYREARLALDTSAVVLTGANGAGKTNLLEALSFLAPGRGLRRAKLSEIDHREGPGTGWAVAATVETGHGALSIGTGREAGNGERRSVRIDGANAASQAALGRQLGLVWLTPAMDRLFVDPPGERRRFLDRLVFGYDPDHASRLAGYEQAMRERARLLRDGPADAAWLSALEEIMAAQGVAVAAARRDLVARLDAACAIAAGPFPRARLALNGTVETWLDAMPALAAEEKLRSALCERRRVDALAGTTSIGAHRSDLAVTHAGKGVPAEHASTGEQKALLIAILLAHARLQREMRGAAPLLLLDEVAAHLDRDRRLALFEALLALDGQVWLTGTDETVFAPLAGSAQLLSIHDGTALRRH